MRSRHHGVFIGANLNCFFGRFLMSNNWMVDLGFLVDCVSTYSPFWGWDGMELACLAVASSGTIIRDHYRRKHRRNFL